MPADDPRAITAADTQGTLSVLLCCFTGIVLLNSCSSAVRYVFLQPHFTSRWRHSKEKQFARSQDVDFGSLTPGRPLHTPISAGKIIQWGHVIGGDKG